MYMSYPFMPIPASTELGIFVYFVSLKSTATPFRRPSSAARGHMPLAPTFRYCGGRRCDFVMGLGQLDEVKQQQKWKCMPRYGVIAKGTSRNQARNSSRDDNART